MSDALSSQAEGLIEVCEKMIAAGGGSKFVDATTGAVAEKILEEAKKQLPGDSVSRSCDIFPRNKVVVTPDRNDDGSEMEAAASRSSEASSAGHSRPGVKSTPRRARTTVDAVRVAVT